MLRPGHDVTVLVTGGPVWFALEAARALAAEGIQAEIINVATIKPLDEETILRSAARTGHVVTVEDHSIHGGLGSAVAELDRKSTRLNSSHEDLSRMPSSA